MRPEDREKRNINICTQLEGFRCPFGFRQRPRPKWQVRTVYKSSFRGRKLSFLTGFTFYLLLFSRMETRPRATIAILGATGGTGSATIRTLLSNGSSDFRLHLFVRSLAKLQSLFPHIHSERHVKIFEGTLSDIECVKKCLDGAKFIVCAIGENKNRPGMHMVRDAARTITNALAQLKEHAPEWRKPHVTMLSSATVNERFLADSSPILHWLLLNAHNHIYSDVVAGEAILKESPSLLSVTIVQPPMIFEGEPSGYIISTESIQPAISYSDLGAAMAEVAAEDGYRGIRVGVYGKQGPGALFFFLDNIRRLSIGFLGRWVPGFWTVYDALESVSSGK